MPHGTVVRTRMSRQQSVGNRQVTLLRAHTCENVRAQAELIKERISRGNGGLTSVVGAAKGTTRSWELQWGHLKNICRQHSGGVDVRSHCPLQMYPCTSDSVIRKSKFFKHRSFPWLQKGKRPRAFRASLEECFEHRRTRRKRKTR